MQNVRQYKLDKLKQAEKLNPDQKRYNFWIALKKTWLQKNSYANRVFW